MIAGTIIGREQEMTALQRSMDSDRSEFVIDKMIFCFGLASYSGLL